MKTLKTILLLVLSSMTLHASEYYWEYNHRQYYHVGTVPDGLPYNNVSTSWDEIFQKFNQDMYRYLRPY